MSKILIVCSDTTTYASVRKSLTKNLHVSDITDTFESALLMMENDLYDILIIDNDFLKICASDPLTKASKTNAFLQIILLSKDSDIRHYMHATENKANYYLPKPIDNDALISAIGYIEERKALYEQITFLKNQNLLSSKRLEDAVDQHTKYLEKTAIGVIKLMFTIIKLKDPLTYSHQTRVGNLAAAIAEKLCLDTEQIESLRLIGYMHDIGKMAVPIEILSKPGKLSDLEMEMIRNHSYYGYDMIRNAQIPLVIAETVLQHHERCDGSGYPKGLSKDEIGFKSKILMVADVVESMASHRPYRPALSIQLALEEITKNVGILYDPDIVCACEDLFLSDHYKIDETQYDIDLSFNAK